VRRQLAFYLIAFSAVCAAQSQPASSTPETVYFVGAGVVAPELIPASGLLDEIPHCKKHDGISRILTVVDTQGNPTAPAVLRQGAFELDEVAVGVVAGDRFKPGTFHGKPARIWVAVELHLQACVVKPPKGSDEAPKASLRAQPLQTVSLLPLPPQFINGALASAPVHPPEDGVYRVGGGVAAPIALNSVEAHYTETARKARIMGLCQVRLVVDTNGMPQSPTVIKSLRPDLDDQALKAVLQYRFKPAMRGDVPVPVMIAVEINFRLY
jgi:TonB family protein